MLLAIDVGNTNTSVGVFVEETLTCEFDLSTRRNWTADEVIVSLSQCLALRGIDPKRDGMRHAAIACVVPSALRPLVVGLERYWQIESLVVGPGIRTGLPVKYDPPRDVGADRVVAAVAAHDRYVRAAGRKCGVIVVDFGTATTFDVVSPIPEFLGGVIAPGIGISADALFTHAARLPRVDFERPHCVIGRNTVHAMQSGLLHGYVCLVEGMIAKIRQELSWPAIVVATGGFAARIAAETTSIEHVDHALMVEGLRLIFARNGGEEH
jgi:type III pantothenate kinase